MVVVVDHSTEENSATQISIISGTFVLQSTHLMEQLVHKSLLCHLCTGSLGSPCSPQLMSVVHGRRALALQKETRVSLVSSHFGTSF